MEQWVDSHSSAKISIQLPATGMALKSSPISTSLTATSVNSFSDWSSGNPTNLNSFNCYMVTVGAPEINRNTCVQKAASSVTKISFGPSAGPMLAGSLLNLEVASGSNRVVTLIGFQAFSEAACQDYRTAGFDQSGLSKPYIIGQSAPTTLRPTLPGDFIPVEIVMGFDPQNWFDDCTGADLNNLNQLHVATKVTLKKTAFPADILVADKQCNEIEIQLKDSLDREAISPNLLTGSLLFDGSPIAIFGTYSECAASAAATPTPAPSPFEISIGSSYIKRYFWVNRTTATPYLANLSLQINSDSVIPDLKLPRSIQVKASSDVKYEITGPKSILVNTCYQIEFSKKSLTNNFIQGDTTANLTLTLPAGFKLFSNIECTTEIMDLTRINFTTGATASPTPLYFKSGTLVGPSSIALSNPSLSSEISGRLNFVVSNSSSLPIKLSVHESRSLPNIVSKCYGPFHLGQENDFGAEVPNRSGVIRTISLLATTPSSDLTIVEHCNDTVQPSTFYIFTAQSNFTFYIKTNPSAVASGLRTVTFTETKNSSSVVYPFVFDLN